MQSSSGFNLMGAARRVLTALLCAGAVFAAGCHNNNLNSGYGIAWVTLTDSPSDFTSYIINVDSVTLTRNDGAVVTALATAESVDFTKLSNIAELWGSATIPNGTYTSVSIALDYTSAIIALQVNGLPVQATVQDTTGAAVGAETINIIFDPVNPLVIPPTYATTSAQRLALNFDLSASTVGINPTGAAGGAPLVVVRPYITAAIAPSDTKPIRIRGPLINSNVDIGTYTVYERPFHDVVDNLGTLTLFTTPSTIFTTNGTVKQGAPGLSQLSQSSAGATVTAAYTTFQPTATPTATAGQFTALYVVAGSTLEDVYTSGLEGDVTGRNGNTLTVQGSTLAVQGTAQTLGNGLAYNVANAQVLLGPDTLVTADNTTLTTLNYNSVAVGQHIIARGICTAGTACGYSGSTVVLDATGSTTNTGSIRLIPTQLWGSLVSAATGSLLLNLETINNWPVSDFAFAGNGTSSATTPVPASFAVDTGTLPIPDTTPGDPLWIDGVVSAFGSAPPAFDATSVNSELSVQTAGQTASSAAEAPSAANPTPGSCAPWNFDCVPASMQVYFTAPGSTQALSSLSAAGALVNLTAVNSAVIRIGPEVINMTTLATPVQIVPAGTLPVVTKNLGTPGSITVTLPPIFLPEFSFGNPTVAAPGGISVFSNFASFASGLTAALPAAPAQMLEARGTYNRSTNTFNANSLNVVL